MEPDTRAECVVPLPHLGESRGSPLSTAGTWAPHSGGSAVILGLPVTTSQVNSLLSGSCLSSLVTSSFVSNHPLGVSCKELSTIQARQTLLGTSLKCLYSALTPADGLAEYRMLDWKWLFLQNLKALLSSLLASNVATENPDIISSLGPLCVTCISLSASLPDPPLTPVFWNSPGTCLGVRSFLTPCARNTAGPSDGAISVLPSWEILSFYFEMFLPSALPVLPGTPVGHILELLNSISNLFLSLLSHFPTFLFVSLFNSFFWKT